MHSVFKNATVMLPEGFVKTDIVVTDGIITAIGNELSENIEAFDFDNCYIFPGFADVHVHLREPGFSYKETIRTGTLACARGGYTDVCSMPNLNPVPDSVNNLKVQTDIITRDAVITVHPNAAITIGEKGELLADMEALAENAAAFSDDGKGVQNEDMMRTAMLRAKKLGKVIAAHCEDNSYLGGGYIRDCEYSRMHNHKGIMPESEWKQVERDIRLAEETGCAYHICHVSTKESVELIRQAKKRGVNITAETGPHYLVLTTDDLCEDAKFKMNPPLGTPEDRDALLLAVNDGTIDMIATDHAPHSAEEKSRGLKDSPMGIVGIETAFPVLYTKLVMERKMTLDRLLQMLIKNPRERFSLGCGKIAVGEKADFSVYELGQKYVIDSSEFLSMGKCTPFDGMEVYGKCRMTVCKGKIVWRDK